MLLYIFKSIYYYFFQGLILSYIYFVFNRRLPNFKSSEHFSQIDIGISCFFFFLKFYKYMLFYIYFLKLSVVLFSPIYFTYIFYRKTLYSNLSIQ